jgi:hypothetical protein
VNTLVVNCSASHYNLGAAKLADYLRQEGHCVDFSCGDPGPLLCLGYDLVCLSVIFSWHAPLARQIALRVKGDADVWCGGPGMYMLHHWWKRETGMTAQRGVDDRFERQRGDYRMTFASRGCPVGCYFCIVPRMEGKTFTLYSDFQPAPVLCDNNLSALPVEFQEHILRRYQETGVTLLDANSGFEPRSFDAETYLRWKPVLRGPWRFAYDETSETEDVHRMMSLLKEVSARKKRVYVLVGNEPVEACYARAQRVIEWGGEPHCQYVLPLHWLGDPQELKPRFDWTYQKGKDFCRYYNRPGIWRAIPIWEYSNRKGEAPPFREIAVKRLAQEFLRFSPGGPM